MDTTTHHTVATLFAQLGLPDDPAQIRAFIARHRPLPDDMRLADAPIWTDAQATFLKEQLRADDGDWALPIDQLSALLREHTPAHDLPQADPADANEGEGSVTAARRYNEATQAFVAEHDVGAARARE